MTPLFKNCNILKFAVIINVQGCIFIKNCFNQSSFFNFYWKLHKLVSTTHPCNTRSAGIVNFVNTRSARNGLSFAPSFKSVRCVRKSIFHSITLAWNYLQDNINGCDFLFNTKKSQNFVTLKEGTFVDRNFHNISFWPFPWMFMYARFFKIGH